ncbi:hypothetical protein D0T11_03170 [Hymenobacter rubripertinctus]|uniref:Uncharacterized protein n=1 Tax=Hymenobacter rubripertinctus TaxID=2029981 RepID=A0A418R7W2_9BACT|nr:hypothetical protein D0T11_03170 [Hymenobacter rubripertinctus]
MLRRGVRVVAHVLFQIALGLAYALRSVGVVRLPFHFQHGADEAVRSVRSPRIRPRAGLAVRPAL